MSASVDGKDRASTYAGQATVWNWLAYQMQTVTKAASGRPGSASGEGPADRSPFWAQTNSVRAGSPEEDIMASNSAAAYLVRNSSTVRGTIVYPAIAGASATRRHGSGPGRMPYCRAGRNTSRIDAMARDASMSASELAGRNGAAAVSATRAFSSAERIS